MALQQKLRTVLHHELAGLVLAAVGTFMGSLAVNLPGGGWSGAAGSSKYFPLFSSREPIHLDLDDSNRQSSSDLPLFSLGSEG